jgi:hypothetical protein
MAAATDRKHWAEYHRTLRRDLKQQGLCARCRQARGSNGTVTMCRRCTDKLAGKR